MGVVSKSVYSLEFLRLLLMEIKERKKRKPDIPMDLVLYNDFVVFYLQPKIYFIAETCTTIIFTFALSIFYMFHCQNNVTCILAIYY